jgi:ATP-dependent helicase STH1/SNF2
MKSDHERRKKIKHKEFMQHLRAHKEEFMEWHRKKQKDRKKIANQAKAIIDAKRKSKEDLEDKATQARLKALQQQDMTKYFELVKEAKNNKIKELLGQTNKFLKELGAKVLIQKGNNQDEG